MRSIRDWYAAGRIGEDDFNAFDSKASNTLSPGFVGERLRFAGSFALWLGFGCIWIPLLVAVQIADLPEGNSVGRHVMAVPYVIWFEVVQAIVGVLFIVAGFLLRGSGRRRWKEELVELALMENHLFRKAGRAGPSPR